VPVSLTAAPVAPSPVSATFRRFSRVTHFLRLEERLRGGARSTPGLRPNPTFSPANSPVSLVDRMLLLTASAVLSEIAQLRRRGCTLRAIAASLSTRALRTRHRLASRARCADHSCSVSDVPGR
jgi:hypothetical protein